MTYCSSSSNSRSQRN